LSEKLEKISSQKALLQRRLSGDDASAMDTSGDDDDEAKAVAALSDDDARAQLQTVSR
jgi:hypothetical protein